MARRTRYTEYKDRYANYSFELTDDGILFMQCHTNGGSLVWDWRAHDEMSDAFADIAGDREIKVLIHTGTGENYNADWGRLPNGELPEKPIYDAMPGVKGLRKLDEKAWYARHLIFNVLDVDVPIAAAFAFVPAVSMLQVIPISFGGLGVREGALVWFRYGLGVSGSAAATAGLLWYASLFVVSLIGAPMFAIGQRRREPTNADTGAELADRSVTAQP